MYPHHTFQIPVMGIGFTLDTPLKVARYGISSVISLVDDTLIEQVRQYYCRQYGEEYTAITRDDEDYRARRITAYLNLLDRIITRQFQELKASAFEIGTEITRYFELLPDTAPLKVLYTRMLTTEDPQARQTMQNELRSGLRVGRIDVNIMTKVDRTNFSRVDDSPLPPEYSDALSALRGYAQSTLDSAIVLSAGINRRLYNYIAEFKDFYADASGVIRKKIILKVSDYRSALIQGRFFAKKGLWVSEFRVESGLNCGGHTFPSAGQLLGSILHEFKTRRAELLDGLAKTYQKAVAARSSVPAAALPIYITAQGGIGTAQEDRFLRDHYQVDATGWGSPFLLCPEATAVDPETLELLRQAGEKDLYLSDVSPLGVTFNNLKGSPSERKKNERIAAGRPGSPCPKSHLCFNTEFTERPVCTASRFYQQKKLAQLAEQGLPQEEYEQAYQKVVMKSCICHDLGGGLLIKYGISDHTKTFPAVCPGPNLAYFSRIMTLEELVDHIYGRADLLNAQPRPHMFVTELRMNIEHFMDQIRQRRFTIPEDQLAYFEDYRANLLHAMDYYDELFQRLGQAFDQGVEQVCRDFQTGRAALTAFINEHALFHTAVPS